MRSFEYIRPTNLEKALGLLDQYGPEASMLAGGTDLLVRLRMGLALPRVVIDLKRIEALGPSIVETGGRLRIGALAILADLIEDERLRRHFPALVEAARTVGSVQIRNRATLAGNICNASPAADTAPALLVYGAAVNLISAAGGRSVPIEDFFTGPGQTVLKRGEIVESIDLPLPPDRTGAAFCRLTRRRGIDIATVNVCCLVKATGETRFAFGAVGPRPILVQGEESALQRLIAQASPISDVRASREYRQAMLLVLSRRALREATERSCKSR